MKSEIRKADSGNLKSKAVVAPTFGLAELRCGRQLLSVRRSAKHFAMRKLIAMFPVVVAVVLACGCSTTKPPPTSTFQNDPTGLFISVTKSFGMTDSYYLGSDDTWSYFKTTGESLFMPTYRKVETSTMMLSHTFPFGEGKPYRIQLSDFGYDTNRASNTALEPK